MRIKKTISTKIDTIDPNVIYSPNIDVRIREVIEEKYKDKCFKSCFLQNIEKITFSEVITEYHRVGGTCTVSIQFDATAIFYDQFEVIPDCRVVHIIKDGKIILANDHCEVLLAASPALNKLTIGDILPIRVFKAYYKPFQSKITISGIPFQQLPFEIYNRDNITISELPDIQAIQDLRKEIDIPAALLKKLYGKMSSKSLIPFIDIPLNSPFSIKYTGIHVDAFSVVVSDEKNDEDTPPLDGTAIIAGIINAELKELQTIQQLIAHKLVEDKKMWNVYSSKHGGDDEA